MAEIYNNPVILTECDKARQAIINAGITYGTITKADWLLLMSILEAKLAEFNKNKDVNTYQMKLIKQEYIADPCAGMFAAYSKVLCDEYSEREAITFNTNGWIGFVGWADSTHTKPFTDAFVLWVNELIKRGVNNA